MEQLRTKYLDRNVEFIAMYVREPHAGERGFPDIRDHESFEDKMEIAQELVELKDIELTVGVDDMTQEQHKTLGNLPNMAYVVDRQGRVAYSNTWQHAEDIDATLARLVTADDSSRPVTPTISTSKLSTSI